MPGRHVGPRLECIAVKHEPVDSLAERLVSQRLERRRMLLPPFVVGGREGLGADDRLAVGVRRRGHAPAGLDGAAADPELAHRLIGLAGVREMVAGAAISLGRELEPVLDGRAGSCGPRSWR